MPWQEHRDGRCGHAASSRQLHSSQARATGTVSASRTVAGSSMLAGWVAKQLSASVMPAPLARYGAPGRLRGMAPDPMGPVADDGRLGLVIDAPPAGFGPALPARRGFGATATGGSVWVCRAVTARVGGLGGTSFPAAACYTCQSGGAWRAPPAHSHRPQSSAGPTRTWS